jgi:hypothetical protein
VCCANTVQKRIRGTYREYIKENLPSEYDSPSAKYKFIDIDKDGIEELIFRYSISGRGHYTLLTYKEGEIYVLFQEYLSCIYVNDKVGKLCLSHSDGATYGIYKEYRLKKGKCKNIAKYYISSEISDKGEAYVKNSKIISEEEYTKAISKYLKWKKI